MSTLTIRLPEVKHARLRRLADSRGVSMNRLMMNWRPSLSPSMTPRYDSVRWRPRVPRPEGLICWTSSTANSADARSREKHIAGIGG